MSSHFNLEVEGRILFLLLKTTHEQSFMLVDKLKMKPKHDLNVWIKQGEKLLSNITVKEAEPYMDTLSDAIHTQINEIRKALQIVDENNNSKN